MHFIEIDVGIYDARAASSISASLTKTAVRTIYAGK